MGPCLIMGLAVNPVSCWVGDCSVMDGTLSCDGFNVLLKQSPGGFVGIVL